MLKPSPQWTAEWICIAINNRNENIIIEILFTQTNKQIKQLSGEYMKLYNKNLCDDMKNVFGSKEKTFVNNVNKKWTNNDAERLGVWNILEELIVARSWSHLNIILNTFEMQTRISLIYELNKLNPHKYASGKEVLIVLNSKYISFIILLFCEKIVSFV